MSKYFSLYLLMLFPGTTAYPQSAVDTTFLNTAIQNTISLYRQELKSHAKIYNGSKYPSTYVSFDEHPFFLSEDWITGDVFYDGELFTDAPLMYDIVSDNLITEHFPSGHAIQLVFGKLIRFSIAGHHFEKIEKESVKGSLPRTGFYDILYAGETRVIALRQKIKRVLIESRAVETSFGEKDRYYIFKNGIFFHVKNKASVVRVLADEKQSIKKFLKTNKIFVNNWESSLKKLAEYYDTLKNK